MTSITFAERAPQRVGVVEHQGAYQNINKAFDKLQNLAMQSPAADWENGVFGIYYSDPQSTPEAELQSAAAIALRDDMEIDGLETRMIAGGRYAMMEHKGPYEGLPQAWEFLTSELLGSGEAAFRHEPALEIYVNNPADTPPEQLLTILALPVL